MTKAIKRNDPCPCGSEKKFKQCCEGKPAVARPTSGRNKVPLYLFFLVLAGAAVAAVMSTTSTNTDANAPAIVPATGPRTAPLTPNRDHVANDLSSVGASTQADPSSGLYPAPPGPAPAGKVWSPEHGHWHDQVEPDRHSTAIAGAVYDPETGFYESPPGPAPAGKIWSPEHGHWHNDSSPQAEPLVTRKPIARINTDVARQLRKGYHPYATPLSAELTLLMNL